MKTPAFLQLHIPELMHAASQLPCIGELAISNNRLLYVDVDDAYIHQLFPLLKNKAIHKPDYFNKNKGSVGAHVTVIYPEENKNIDSVDLGIKHQFVIKNFVAATLGAKKYYILLVESPTLLHLRRKYHLPDLLCFKGYSIGFHITIGVCTSI